MKRTNSVIEAKVLEPFSRAAFSFLYKPFNSNLSLSFSFLVDQLNTSAALTALIPDSC